MNNRRNLLFALGASALAVAAPMRAQALPRIAWIGPSDAAGQVRYIAAFKEGMRENGLLDGKDYVLDAQYADGHYDRFPAMVDAALKRDPALIDVIPIASVRAPQQATKAVPIVFVSTNEPLGSGLVASLARPGGNTTGISNQAEDVIVKYVELLREALPQTKRVAVLLNPGNPSNLRMFERVRGSAHDRGISVTAYEAGSPEAIDAALERIARQRPDALLPNSDAMLLPVSRPHRGVRTQGAAAFDRHITGNCQIRLPVGLRCEPARHVSPRSDLRTEDPRRRQARRSARRATDEVRAGDQLEDREGTRGDDPAIAAAAPTR